MSRCSFYRLHTPPENSSSPFPAVNAPWCAHPQSKVWIFAAAATLGGAKLLKCGGDNEKCTLPQPDPKP